MKGFVLAMLVSAPMLLGGCAATKIASDYDWVKQQDFSYHDIDWVVLDRTAEHRLLLRPSLGDAAAAGQMAKDLGVDKKIGGFDEVIAAWFKSHGRNCTVTQTDVVIETWRQYHYSCAA